MRKIKKNNNKLIIAVPIVLVLFTILILNANNIRILYLSKTTGYQEETIEVFLDENLYSKIKNHEYSKTLEVVLNTEYYNQKHIDAYLNITFLDNDNFLKNISLLLDQGYNASNINNINNKLNNDSINILINNDYIKDIENILSIEYFKETNLERYLKYYQKEKLDIETIITYVNIGLDNSYYTNITNIENQDALLVLVNKYNKLQKDYVPKDLENISSKYGTGQLKKEAKIAFEKMCQAAKQDKITIYGGSGYRSYSHQRNLYYRYVAQDGQTEADTYSARAGHSEHQTGLAMDIMNGRWGYIDKSDKEYTWLINNSYKYGFILRYLEGKEKITGYMYEPWHYRYVGTELATEITKLGITYDEYVAKNSWQKAYVIIKLYT